MRKNRKKIVIISLCITAFLVVGATVAFFTAQTGITNKINMGKIDVEVQETVSNGIKTNVGVLVKGDSSPCWVRVFVGMPKGEHENPENGDLFDLEGFDSDNWTLNTDDGYYYYNNLVTPMDGKDVSLILFTRIKSKEGLSEIELPANSDVVIYTEAVQKEFGDSAVGAFANKK